jgi:subtilase family serine protease
MRKLRRIAPAAIAAVLLLAAAASSGSAAPSWKAHRVCASPANDTAECNALVLADSSGTPFATTAPTGLSPAQFHSAYSLPTTAPGTPTIGIVDAYDDPTAAADLATFSSKFGLPACGTGCFKKVSQNGSTSGLPKSDSGWALEISLDVQIAHAICQNCHILLVEARSSRFSDLATAENTAAALGASVISNSYGGGEFSGETSSDSAFNHPGIPITVSSGDSGYGVEYPAASQYVTAVGGTTLTLDSNGNRVSETAWNGTGSGCSAYEPKPPWQTDTAGCAKRTVADVSADADPASGASIYDSTSYQGQRGWWRVGGTSLASPLVASVYALAGNGSSTTYGSFPYAHSGSLFDVTSGSNGSCTPSYLCTAGSLFDGPTGLGSPNGMGGF